MSKLRNFLIGKWSWKRPFISLAAIYIILLFISLGCVNHFIFYPPQDTYKNDLPQLQLISGPDGQIATVHYPARAGMPTLLWSHGNAEDLKHKAPLFIAFQNQGFGVMAYDYPGYGISEGKPSESSCYEAIDAVWNDMTDTHHIPADKIIIIGQSVGSGPSCYLAEKHPECAGLALISPFTSIYRVPFRYSIFPRDPFPNIRRISNIHVPLLVIHGTADTTIPPHHGEALIKAHPAHHKLILLKDLNHNDIYGDSLDAFAQQITDFFKMDSSS